jgi:hypothetical protein
VSETALMNRIVLGVCRAMRNVRMFRNDVRQGWCGNAQRFGGPATVDVRAGDVLIRGAHPLHAGLCDGSSDHIGLTIITVLPQHVGAKIAVFTGVESKTGDGRESKEQVKWRKFLRAAGAIAVTARSPEEAIAEIGRQAARLGSRPAFDGISELCDSALSKV